ncbi:MAG: hypothetical protein LQ339_008969 [Xanthoria mediterranea]|nr:MAG: hypothetical protein LQ339_008969 [Xanthoria mediterranea]
MSLAFRPTNALFRSSLLNLLLLLQTYVSIAQCAIISPNGLLLPQSQNFSANPEATDLHCVHTPQWWDRRAFDIGDCFGTFYMMQYNEGVDPYAPVVRKEFQTRSASSNLPPGEAVLTPRKYVVGTCTLAILMRVEARPGDLPGEDDRSTITNDVSSFRTLGYVASKIYDKCGKPLKSPGWATVGEGGGMAIAFWGTGSSIDKHYQDLRPIIALPSLPRPDVLRKSA